MTPHLIALILAILMTCISQLLLKAGAQSNAQLTRTYTHSKSVIAYGLFFLVTLLGVYSLQAIPLSAFVTATTSSYVIVTVAAHYLFDEKLSHTSILGCICIIGGIAVFVA